MKKIFITIILLIMYTSVSLSTVMGAEIVDINCNIFDADENHSSFMYNDVSIKIHNAKIWSFYWTGKEFLTSDIDKKYFQKSLDLSEWEDFYIEDEMRSKIFSGMSSPEIQFVGGKYIAYNTVYFDPSIGIKYLRYNDKQELYPLFVLDEGFNLLYEHVFDEPMMDFGYTDGIYYVKTGYCYADENDNIKYETKIYDSTDATNWTIDKTLDEIPLSNGVKNNIDIHTQLVNRSGAAYEFEIDNLMISNEKLDKTTVVYEKKPEGQYRVIGDLYIAFQEGAKIVSVSLDGVYWLQIDMSAYAGDYTTLFDRYYRWNDKLVFRKGYRLLEYDLAEMQAVLNQKCPIDTPYIKLNDNILGFETPPVIEDGSTLVPIRFLFEQMGAQVDWEQTEQTATISQNNTTVRFTIDDPTAFVNGAPAEMNVPARLINGKTMVPLRFLSENLGYTVDWDEGSRTAIIE